MENTKIRVLFGCAAEKIRVQLFNRASIMEAQRADKVPALFKHENTIVTDCSQIVENGYPIIFLFNAKLAH